MGIFDSEQVQAGIKNVARMRRLKIVALFGSQATGAAHAKSDVDIAVLGDAPLSFDARLQLISDFSSVIGRDDVEVVDLAIASPTLMYVVVRDGQLLYESVSGSFFSWKLRAIREWLDTAWLRALRDMRLIQWAARASA